MSSITVLEDAIIKQLKQELSGLIKTSSIKSYSGEYAEVADRLVPDMPMILVVYTGESSESDAFTVDMDDIISEEDLTNLIVYRFEIHILARSYRNEATARRKAHGAYELIDEIKHVLDKRRLEQVSCAPIDIISVDYAGYVQTPANPIYTIALNWLQIKAV